MIIIGPSFYKFMFFSFRPPCLLVLHFKGFIHHSFKSFPQYFNMTVIYLGGVPEEIIDNIERIGKPFEVERRYTSVNVYYVSNGEKKSRVAQLLHQPPETAFILLIDNDFGAPRCAVREFTRSVEETFRESGHIISEEEYMSRVARYTGGFSARRHRTRRDIARQLRLYPEHILERYSEGGCDSPECGEIDEILKPWPPAVRKLCISDVLDGKTKRAATLGSAPKTF
jgi:hypothetical protein